MSQIWKAEKVDGIQQFWTKAHSQYGSLNLGQVEDTVNNTTAHSWHYHGFLSKYHSIDMSIEWAL